MLACEMTADVFGLEKEDFFSGAVSGQEQKRICP